MLRFRLFGIPITVQPLFWLIAALIGYMVAIKPGPQAGPTMIIGVAAVFVSILAHELGHALAYRKYGGFPQIILHGFGGVTSAQGYYDRKQSIFITAAGPAVSLSLAGICILLAVGIPMVPKYLGFALTVMTWINIFWSIINLLPVFPLDGGQILYHVLGPGKQRTTWLVGIVVGVLVVLYALPGGQLWLGAIFAMLTYQNWQRYQGKQPAGF